MEIRYSCNQRDFKRYTTEETRKEFLIENLYAANEVVAVYSHVDRMVTLGCMPTTETVSIDKGIDIRHNFGTVPFPVSWTVKMKKKQKETQDILSYHTQAAGCSDKARAKASGGRQPIEECGRTGL